MMYFSLCGIVPLLVIRYFAVVNVLLLFFSVNYIQINLLFMKTLRLFYFALFFFLCTTSVFAQGAFVAIPDANFRSYLEVHYPSSMQDGNLYYETVAISTTTTLDVSNLNIIDFTGIEYFAGLKILTCRYNLLTQLPPLPEGVREVYADHNLLTAFPTNFPSTIKTVTCSYNQITTNLTSLPNLQNLDCSNNPLTGISSLPASLITLNCSATGISSLPALPPALYTLKADTNQLTSLPALPATLNLLNVSINELTALPALPNKLKSLTCSYNNLTALPVPLPDSLRILDCAHNELTELPTIPTTIFRLTCQNNHLTSLAPFQEENLIFLVDCSDNLLTELPPLSGLKLRIFLCNNNQLTCLPYLPNTLAVLSVGGNLFSCIPNLPPDLTVPSDITDLCDQTDPAADCDYPRIIGKVFIDANTNNIQDGGETGLPYAKLEIQPGNLIVLADLDGNYSIPLDIRDYTIRIYSEDYPHYTFSPATQSASFTAYGQTDNGNDFAASFTSTLNDLEITMTPHSRIRAAFVTGYTITYANRGTTTLSGTVSLVYNADLSLNLATPVATSHIGQTMEWAFTNLHPGQTKNITLYFVPPTTVPVNTVYTYTATINPVSGDETVDNNQYVLNHTVTGSYDPNFKEVAPAGNITPEEVAVQDPFTYVVHFQNTGNDLAFVVTIKDTISTNFEIEGIETISASHPYTFRMSEGAALWTFDNILLPDSTSDERNSHGFVKYRIIPKNTLQLGDEIKNTAHIFFDYNDPIKTNTTTNRVANTTGVHEASNDHLLQLYPNPSNGLFYLNCNLNETGTIKVMNTEGKLLYTQDAADLSQPQAIELYGGKGIYVVQVIAGQKTMTKKLVLN